MRVCECVCGSRASVCACEYIYIHSYAYIRTHSYTHICICPSEMDESARARRRAQALALMMCAYVQRTRYHMRAGHASLAFIASRVACVPRRKRQAMATNPARTCFQTRYHGYRHAFVAMARACACWLYVRMRRRARAADSAARCVHSAPRAPSMSLPRLYIAARGYL